MTGEKDRYRSMTTAAVLLVAAIAAVVSYMHVVSLAIRYGQPQVAAYLLPVSVDGLVAVSSLVMLRAARLGVSTPWLARSGLGLAIVATLACNVAYGLPHGATGALLSGWPAVAFVVAAEMAISMTRRRAPAQRYAPADDVHRSAVPAARKRTRTLRTPAAPMTDTEAASAFMDELAAGAVPSIRQIRTRLHVGQDRAQQVQAHLRTLARTP
jgi:hypothetical protein